MTRWTMALIGMGLSTLSQATAETHRFKPEVGYPTYTVREPVLRVAPGDTVELKLTLENLSDSDTVDSISFSDDLDATLSGLEASGATSNTGGSSRSRPRTPPTPRAGSTRTGSPART